MYNIRIIFILFLITSLAWTKDHWNIDCLGKVRHSQTGFEEKSKDAYDAFDGWAVLQIKYWLDNRKDSAIVTEMVPSDTSNDGHTWQKYVEYRAGVMFYIFSYPKISRKLSPRMRRYLHNIRLFTYAEYRSYLSHDTDQTDDFVKHNYSIGFDYYADNHLSEEKFYWTIYSLFAYETTGFSEYIVDESIKDIHASAELTYGPKFVLFDNHLVIPYVVTEISYGFKNDTRWYTNYQRIGIGARWYPFAYQYGRPNHSIFSRRLNFFTNILHNIAWLAEEPENDVRKNDFIFGISFSSGGEYHNNLMANKNRWMVKNSDRKSHCSKRDSGSGCYIVKAQPFQKGDSPSKESKKSSPSKIAAVGLSIKHACSSVVHYATLPFKKVAHKIGSKSSSKSHTPDTKKQPPVIKKENSPSKKDFQSKLLTHKKAPSKVEKAPKPHKKKHSWSKLKPSKKKVTSPKPSPKNPPKVSKKSSFSKILTSSKKQPHKKDKIGETPRPKKQEKAPIKSAPAKSTSIESKPKEKSSKGTTVLQNNQKKDSKKEAIIPQKETAKPKQEVDILSMSDEEFEAFLNQSSVDSSSSSDTDGNQGHIQLIFQHDRGILSRFQWLQRGEEPDLSPNQVNQLEDKSSSFQVQHKVSLVPRKQDQFKSPSISSLASLYQGNNGITQILLDKKIFNLGEHHGEIKQIVRFFVQLQDSFLVECQRNHYIKNNFINKEFLEQLSSGTEDFTNFYKLLENRMSSFETKAWISTLQQMNDREKSILVNSLKQFLSPQSPASLVDQALIIGVSESLFFCFSEQSIQDLIQIKRDILIKIIQTDVDNDSNHIDLETNIMSLYL